MLDRKSLSLKRRRQIIGAQDHCCAKCGNSLVEGHIEFDHIQALEHDGDNEADNWQALCVDCHKNKTRADHQNRAKRDRISLGGKPRKGPPMPGSRASKWKRRMDGTVERRT